MRQLRLPRSFTKADLAAAIMGGWDGCISVLAVLIAAHRISSDQLLIAGLGGSIGGMFSMGTGQYESMDGGPRTKLRESVIMALFTLVGGLLPTLPFLFGSKTIAFMVAGALSWALATVVWMLKKEGAVGALRTYALLVITATATVLVSVILS